MSGVLFSLGRRVIPDNMRQHERGVQAPRRRDVYPLLDSQMLVLLISLLNTDSTGFNLRAIWDLLIGTPDRLPEYRS